MRRRLLKLMRINDVEKVLHFRADLATSDASLDNLEFVNPEDFSGFIDISDCTKKYILLGTNTNSSATFRQTREPIQPVIGNSSYGRPEYYANPMRYVDNGCLAESLGGASGWATRLAYGWTFDGATPVLTVFNQHRSGNSASSYSYKRIYFYLYPDGTVTSDITTTT